MKTKYDIGDSVCVICIFDDKLTLIPARISLIELVATLDSSSLSYSIMAEKPFDLCIKDCYQECEIFTSKNEAHETLFGDANQIIIEEGIINFL